MPESIQRFHWDIMANPKELGVLKNSDYSWAAVAFSSDRRIGKDLVFPCTNDPKAKEVKLRKYVTQIKATII